jgi:hypothetical protein
MPAMHLKAIALNPTFNNDDKNICDFMAEKYATRP